jgi:uncharacterized membrane protein
MRRSDLDLWLVVGLVLAQWLGAGAPEPLRLGVGLPFVLVAPGYALTAALVATPLPAAERVAYSLGLSLAVAALGGLALHLLGVGLHPATWGALLGGLTLVGCAVGFWRRRGSVTPVPVWAAMMPLRARDLGLVLAALVVSGLAVGLAATGASAQRVGFSQLWLLPADPARDAVRVGVRSQELATTAYRLQLVTDGTVLLDSTGVQLGPGEAWETTVALATGQSGQVEAILYRAEVPDVAYRRVWLRRAEDGG